jgi:hypothetical protein
VARARGRFVLLLNPDCEMSPGAVRRLIGRLEAQPAVGAVAPLLLAEDGSPQREFQLRRFPTLRSLAAELLLSERLLGRSVDLDRYRYRDLDISKEQPVEQPAGAALIVRREVIDDVGPLDERFAPAWFEDVDYCRRIWQSGHAIHLVPEAKVIHHGGASLEHMEHGKFISIWYANLNRYARKWLEPREVELLRWCVILGMLLRAAAVSIGVRHFSEGRFEAVKGYLRVIRAAWSRWDENSQSS